MIKKAVIPAAGNATRLRPLTDNCHKSMLPIGQTTMMKLILENLNGAGIEELILITGFKADELKDYVIENRGKLNPIFIHNPEYTITNNAYSLFLAKDSVDKEPFILLDSDIVFEYETLNRVLKSEFSNVLALQKKDNLGEEEMKVFTSDGIKVDMISKTGDPKSALGESIGIEKFDSKFSKVLFEVLEKRIHEGAGRTEYYEHSFQELIDNDFELNMVDISDTMVMEVDFIEDLEKVENDLIPHIIKKNS